MKFTPRPGEAGDVLKGVLGNCRNTKLRGRLGHDDWKGETADDEDAVWLILKHNVNQNAQD